MAALRDRPLFTKVYERAEEFSPTPNSAYIYGLFEERSEHIKGWAQSSSTVRAIKIVDQDRNTIKTDFLAFPDVGLRSKQQLSAFYETLGCEKVYIDITGLSHHVWAPLVRVALERKIQIDAVYVEPGSYKHSPSPRQGEIFDLSEKIEGIAPIPLFTSLADTEQTDICFVPLLGFEGARLRYMLEQVEPPGQKVVPVIGVPGFQLEYPFNAYIGNQPALEETKVWKNTRYARANCPFSVFYVLEEILREYPSEHVKIAPIGTKPHALGAVLLAMAMSRPIELVYDHPKRKVKRTAGALRLLLYSLSDFLP